jgi:hypothetical protein
MLLFSLSIQPLLRTISNTCELKLNKFYAGDGKIGGLFGPPLIPVCDKQG